MSWRTETLNGDDSFKRFGMTADEAKALAKKKLQEAGASEEEIQHALGWDEVVYGIISPSAQKQYEAYKELKFPYMDYVMLITS